ncbi:hypothetical protein MMAG44476_34439 [Mycolicibacterium mageritense DSM 44476 = CIP 104973]|uniref:Transcriptional regulator n=1 Tax=Mycolicibacterium mageritense TaxID=53462 RepID=A0ABM7I568_MYCME|nr:hypothetical protein [Mycolicibacterium mageritense]MCC9184117.1 hypothetical protein [Mycolicibacterium mageritense]BBX38062.1 hypothetical protein MMAGJ_73440 [Mycolicibacterium mageritense]CDO27203.1 hypothetical protein BN978_07769 [Mycolicibacterium mageritense DSM 44476 = CIP 104973]
MIFAQPTPDQIATARQELPAAMARLADLNRETLLGFGEAMIGDPTDPATQRALREYQQWRKGMDAAKMSAAAVMVAAGADPDRVCKELRVGFHALRAYLPFTPYAALAVGEEPEPEDGPVMDAVTVTV